MRDPIWPLQVAVLAKSRAAISSYPVFDDVPENEPVNYIAIGEFEFANESDKTRDRMEIVHTVSCWSQYNGTKKVLEMIAQLITALGEFTPDLSADFFKAKFVRWERGKIARYDSDGVIYRYGHISFRYIIEDLQIEEG